MKRIVVLLSGNGSNLQAIIDSINNGNINGRIVGVISNNIEAFGLKRAQKENINTITINHLDYENRQAFDDALLKKLAILAPDLIVLAGFMRILTSKITDYFNGKIINIHPSLLPLYPGLHTHQKVIDNNDEKHGISIHYVSSELDAGPLIAQGNFNVGEIKDKELLEEKIHKIEHLMLPLVIQYICIGTIYLDVKSNNVVFKNLDVINGSIQKNYEI
ncbi:phosphoribosylglycinamide formyltransferase [Gammaproteobacteria bacterium]|nr:phosphoribosylglycinamide formyltransferase [Gammaproteobacteria bacterium]MDA9196300.1 phosphoribosylglycinamide formyltransferase [Gammaproteobacteria bacterium]MDA9212458.1 phosphoribosylglycinamide formyltransferase [Gammaproteobacteria bacterium]MDA9842718.1 phosphoribosylglycinamide formyltransferase [Gammaproteobacteria bacterium]MDC0410550.1 phosphoribosylglycinamide formyltransferase [Gammaproteobacteria bacterium]|tara:strand:- start:598 stop:1251 length:654 start_codon:yes stop_codon:yes gene_type:complete